MLRRLWKHSWILNHISLGRLFREIPGVEGCGWFAKTPAEGSNRMHTLGNILRTILWCTLAPILLTIHTFYPLIFSTLGLPKISWPSKESTVSKRIALLPNVVLTEEVTTRELSLSKARYQVSALHPRWVLRVTHPLSWHNITDPNYCQQVSWSEDCREAGYTALSYYINNAVTLWTSAGYDAPSGRTTIPQKRYIALRYLLEYSRAYAAKYGCSGEPQYVWIDELCISPLDISSLGPLNVGQLPTLWYQKNSDVTGDERHEELGRLTDIFRTATYVCVFCDRFGCDHTNTTCEWGQRVWTLSEIVHASTVMQMTALSVISGAWEWDLREVEGRSFKGHMKGHAERNERWHLQSVLEHATNSGSTSWQHTIQALVIEVIRRSDVSGYGYDGRKSYSQIGRALNGLLPRRADPKCFSERNGFADLTTLLELNQGFYNPAALAAVCPVAHHTEKFHRWLAKPIDPRPGQERVEPLIKAFPIVDPSPPIVPKSALDKSSGLQSTTLDSTSHEASLNTALCLVNPKVIELSSSFKRDGSTLYSPTMRPLLIFVLVIVGLMFVLGLVMIITAIGLTEVTEIAEAAAGVAEATETTGTAGNISWVQVATGIVISWLAICLYTFVRLALGTLCVKMDGWVCWDERDGELKDVDRAHFDPEFAEFQFRTWDTLHHLAPEFPFPKSTPSRTIHILDLKNRLQVSAKIHANAKKPSYIVPLALHGSGITCMLVNDEEQDYQGPEAKTECVWTKVGMVNLPTFILEDAELVGSFLVGGRELPELHYSRLDC